MDDKEPLKYPLLPWVVVALALIVGLVVGSLLTLWKHGLL